ncbi:MAG: mechanosensitive ion channel family protein, partial [Prevotella sp.]|nr:mechanosensitive ion channel family protein [Prevotella sp.]
FIIFSSPFKVGDFIKIDETITGTVEEITLRHTILRNLENRMILIPNNKINTSTIINSSFGDTSTCAFIDVAVSYTTDLNKAFEVMRDEVMKNPLVIDHRTKAEKEKEVPEVVIRVTSLDNSSITLRAWAWASTSWNAYVLKCESLKAVKERFDKESIEIPYPYYNQIIQQAKQS